MSDGLSPNWLSEELKAIEGLPHPDEWEGHIRKLEAENARLREALIPEGYVLVPREPTPEMIAAARQTTRWGRGDWGDRQPSADTWAAMLAAAPASTQVP